MVSCRDFCVSCVTAVFSLTSHIFVPTDCITCWSLGSCCLQIVTQRINRSCFSLAAVSVFADSCFNTVIQASRFSCNFPCSPGVTVCRQNNFIFVFAAARTVDVSKSFGFTSRVSSHCQVCIPWVRYCHSSVNNCEVVVSIFCNCSDYIICAFIVAVFFVCSDVSSDCDRQFAVHVFHAAFCISPFEFRQCAVTVDIVVACDFNSNVAFSNCEADDLIHRRSISVCTCKVNNCSVLSCIYRSSIQLDPFISDFLFVSYSEQIVSYAFISSVCDFNVFSTCSLILNSDFVINCFAVVDLAGFTVSQCAVISHVESGVDSLDFEYSCQWVGVVNVSACSLNQDSDLSICTNFCWRYLAGIYIAFQICTVVHVSYPFVA